MKKLVLTVALAGAMGVFADEYTVPVPAGAVLVTESPYATGGDFIYRLGEGSSTYLHVYTTAGAATFTPKSDLSAHVLLIGGGGAGGKPNSSNAVGGGGGAGAVGVITNVALTAAAEYAVIVGAGGAGHNTSGGQNNGGDSSFADLLIAHGGMGGKQQSGGSASTCDGAGLGFGGGAGKSGSYSGSGGGAGAPGVNGLDGDGNMISPTGGEGVKTLFTGVEWWVAGGGNGSGGSSTYEAPQNLAGGGLGQTAKTSPTPGRANTGSGGGGVNKGGTSASGASGVVIVRYDGEPSVTPVVNSLSATPTGPTSVMFACVLSTVGSGAEEAQVAITYWPKDDPSAKAEVSAGGVCGRNMFGDLTLEVADLERGVDYVASVVATSVAGTSSAVTVEFSTEHDNPEATGGIVSTNGIRVVHKFLEDGVFTLKYVAKVRLLVVGGGGAGGGQGHSNLSAGCGGGGGGGVVFRELWLNPGAYEVSIGAGGTWADVVSKGHIYGCGEASWFGSVVAHGGGAGAYYKNSANGGSLSVANGGGGNGYKNEVGGSSYYRDEGYLGGTGRTADGPGGGGGGAGGPGQAGIDSNGGAGGPGVAYNFYGFDEYYGGGGGGGAGGTSGAPGGVGGSGVGGNGGYLASGENWNWTETCAGGDGMDGYGGGGGGGKSSDFSASHKGGSGGSGVVIVDYVNYELKSGGNEPTLEQPSVKSVSSTTAEMAIGVVDCGGGAQSVRLLIAYGLAADSLVVTQVLNEAATSADGVVLYEIAGLLPARDYFFKIVAGNGLEDGTAESAVFPFTTTKLIGDAVSFTHDQGTYDFTFTVGELTPEKVTALLMLSTDGGQTYAVADRWAVTEAGDNVKTHVFDTALFGTSYHYRIDLVCEDGGAAWTNSNVQALSASTFYVEDEAVYGWVGGAEGYWDEPANWESSKANGVTRGYPVRGSRADFPADAKVAVKIRKPEECTYLGVNVDNLDFTLLGEGTGAALSCVTPISGCGGNPFGAGSVFTVDGVAFTPALSAAWAFREGQRLVVRNGAVVNVGQTLNPGAAADTYVLITDGGRINASDYTGGRGGQFLIDGGILDVSREFNPFAAGDRQTEVIIGRDGSQLIANRIYSGNNDFTILFDIPAGGYTTVPVSGSGEKIGHNHLSGDGKSDSGKIVTFACVKKSGIRAGRKEEYVTLVNKTSALAYTRVDNTKPVTEGSALFFASSASSTDAITAETGDAACIRFHYVPQPAGLLLLLR